MIKNIEVSKISPHYANPRKDLGDLTELAESIKTNGIFQNLTVVPWFSQTTGVGADDPKQQEEMGYIAVIGHRRLAAAKLAGLTKVPCEISKMSYSEQISTMLLENMQRCDLTIYEQAQGFQMLLDLGESVNDIAQSTGFSETTVRRRVKLLEFDKEKFKDSVERGGTLMDYVELDKIQDVDVKNKVLEKIGTKDFKWELNDAIRKETEIANKSLIIAKLEKFASYIECPVGCQEYVETYYPSQGIEINIPTDISTTEYFFCLSKHSECITLYKKSAISIQAEELSKAEALKTAKRNEILAALAETEKLAHGMRYEFVKNISNTTAKKNLNVISRALMKTLLISEIFLSVQELRSFFDIPKDTEDDDENDDEEAAINDLLDNIDIKPETQLLVLVYLDLESDNRSYNWRGEYCRNENLIALYDFLEEFGYEMSVAETSLCDGTNKLFANLDNQNVDRGND